ncbi:hypothetical protein V6N13_100144 [Hibiscus sabdariffa]|uniref:Uncharacterized protein n=2 Tax=Hibiscus sabdariffa TaxID=183260 RepID=A0ABR2NV37_9ROSI
MAPRKQKLQVEKEMEKGTKVRVQFKRVKAKMGKMKENGECLREEQREIRAKFGEMERQCVRVKEETEMIVQQTARTQIKLALMFNILKAREGGNFIEAAEFTKLLREIVAKERANENSE